MTFTTYEVHTVDEHGMETPLYAQVVATDYEPSLRPSLATKMSTGYRRYKRNREEALRKVHGILDKGYVRTDVTSMTIESAKRAVSYHTLRTLEVLFDEFSADHDASGLIKFLSLPDGYSGTVKLGEEDSIRIREMAVYGRRYGNISVHILGRIIDNLRVSYPMFAYEDLTELGDNEAESFVFALDFSVAVYEYREESFTSRYDRWDETYYSRSVAPRFSPEFIDFLLTHHDRAEDIIKYLQRSNSALLNVDVAELKQRLDAPANLSSAAMDTELLLRGASRIGKYIIGR